MEAQMIQLGAIRASDTNPDGRSDPQTVVTLAESIRKRGLINPITVRRVDGDPGGPYAVVAGHRRLAAARLLQADAIRAFVVDIDDSEAQLVQLAENMEREDLTPAEEAVMIARCGEAIGDIAERIGRPIEVVAPRVRLATAPDVLAALDKGSLATDVAIELAKIHDEATRKKAIKLYRGRELYDAERTIREQFLLKLKDAPFDQKAEPACGKCPKRSNQTEGLFPAREAVRCLDLACWQKKEKEASKLARKEAKANNVKVLKEAQLSAAKLKKLVPPSAVPHGTKKTIRELAGELGVAPTMLERYGSKKVETCYDTSEVLKAARKAKAPWAQKVDAKAKGEREKAAASALEDRIAVETQRRLDRVIAGLARQDSFWQGATEMLFNRAVSRFDWGSARKLADALGLNEEKLEKGEQWKDRIDVWAKQQKAEAKVHALTWYLFLSFFHDKEALAKVFRLPSATVKSIKAEVTKELTDKHKERFGK